MEFAVVLPSGQAYVEVFARQNGIQNVAQNIVNSEQDNGDGDGGKEAMVGPGTPG